MSIEFDPFKPVRGLVEFAKKLGQEAVHLHWPHLHGHRLHEEHIRNQKYVDSQIERLAEGAKPAPRAEGEEPNEPES